MKLVNRVCLLLLGTALNLSAQFSSTVDYVDQQKKIDETQLFGVNLGINTSSFDWNASGLRNSDSTLTGLNCQTNVSITDYRVGAFYSEKKNGDEYSVNAEIVNLNRSATLNLDSNSIRNSFSVNEFTLWQYKLGGKLELAKIPVSVAAKTEISSYDDGLATQSGFFVNLQPAIQLLKNPNHALSAIVGATFFNDGYNSIYKQFLYLTTVPDQYSIGLKYDWKRAEHFVSIGYKFALLPEDLFSKRDYSNLETGYKYSLKQYNLAVGLSAGMNFEHSFKHLVDPEKVLPVYYYSIKLESEYLQNRLLVALNWDLTSVKTRMSDDLKVVEKCNEILNNSTNNYSFTKADSDNYLLKLSLGYRL